MNLISSYGEPLTTTHLIQAGIRDVFACEYNPNITNITIGWKRCILRKVTKSFWEILDESGTELLEEVENDEDNGPIAEWGLWYRNPSEKSIDEAKKNSSFECCWFG